MPSFSIFETTVFEDHLDHLDTLGVIKCLDDHFEKLSSSDNYFTAGSARPLERTNGFDLHQDPQLKTVVEFIRGCCKNYWKDCGYDPSIDSDITQMWAIKTLPGGFTPPHNHNPSVVSGAFYVSVNKDSGNLHLENPLEFMLGKLPFAMGWGPTLRFNKILAPSTGSLFLFPGWLKHFSEPNNSDKIRYVISFNYGYHESFSKNNNG